MGGSFQKADQNGRTVSYEGRRGEWSKRPSFEKSLGRRGSLSQQHLEAVKLSLLFLSAKGFMPTEKEWTKREMGSSENVLALRPWKAYFLFARDKVWILVLALSVCKDFFREKTHTHTQKPDFCCS